MSEQKFTFEALKDPASVSTLLHTLAENIAARTITLSYNEDVLHLTPHDLLHLKVSGSDSPMDSSCTIQLHWSKPPEEKGL